MTSACVRVSNRHKIQSQQQDDHHNFSGSGDDRLFAIKCLSEVSFVGKDVN